MFRIGFLFTAPINEQLSIRPQLLYSVKGVKAGGSAQGISVDAKLAINYLELPVQLAYGFEAGEGRVVVGAGPYLGYALNGALTTTLTYNGQKETETEEVTFGSTTDDAKRIDLGLHLSAGYELSSGLLVSGYFSPGLTSISNGAGSSTKTTAFGLSVGYFFSRR